MDVCKSVSAHRQMKRWRNDVDQPETAGRGREKGVGNIVMSRVGKSIGS